jgi:hypothetical protein
VLASTRIGELYAIEVPDDGIEVRLRRRTRRKARPSRDGPDENPKGSQSASLTLV